jgi:hypothetical protein
MPNINALGCSVKVERENETEEVTGKSVRECSKTNK